MGGCRCSYKNCTNTTKTTENIHFFHYPVKHKERCVQWIENACKPSFYDLEEEQLRNKVVCEVHFENKWFPNNQKKRLLQGAVPTLDGDCNDDNAPMSPVDTDGPVYLPSNQYNDVKVVPANEEGTVFVLDTENMFTISPKIESYIIKNGILVPTNSNNTLRNTPGRYGKQSTLNRFARPSSSSAGHLMGAETEIANINTPPGPSKSVAKDQLLHQPSFIKKEVPDAIEICENNQKPTDNGEFLNYGVTATTQAHETRDRKPNTVSIARQGSSQQNNTHGHSKTVVSRSYLRQIKQHSRDIASIKRMLKQKRILDQAKPDIKSILNELQSQIPPSLLTIISLLIGEKNDLNEDDIEFFTTLHRGSPEVYQMLSDKYKWNLPSVDVVDTSNE